MLDRSVFKFIPEVLDEVEVKDVSRLILLSKHIFMSLGTLEC